MPVFLLPLLLPVSLFAADGRVVDPAGKPLRNVRVWPASVDEQGLAKGPRAVTGPDGRFEIPERILDPEVELSVCLDGYVPERVRPAWLDGPVVLRPASRITGKVTDPAGRPVAGARVQERFQLTQRKPVRTTFDPCRKDGGVAVSGPDGRFTLEGLEPGDYILSAHAPGWLRATSPAVHVPPAGTAEAPATALQAGAVVYGRVLDAQGKPAAGIKVYESGRSVYETGPATTVTDEEGRYRLTGVLPGRIRISAYDEDLGSGDFTPSVLPGENSLDLELTPRSDAYKAAARAKSPTVEVRGRVTGPHGEPVVSAAVWTHRLGDVPSRAGYTREDGTFSLRLEESIYRITVERPGYALTRLEALDVGTRPVEGVAIRMAKGIPLKGRVLLPPGQRTASVMLKSESISWLVPVARDGSFQGELGPGEWEIEAQVFSEDTSRRAQTRVVLEPGKPAPTPELELLVGEETLAGRFASGYNIQRGVRLVRKHPGGARFQAVPNRGGSDFTFDGMAPGPYTLQVYEACCNGRETIVDEQTVHLPAKEPVLIFVDAKTDAKTQ